MEFGQFETKNGNKSHCVKSNKNFKLPSDMLKKVSGMVDSNKSINIKVIAILNRFCIPNQFVNVKKCVNNLPVWQLKNQSFLSGLIELRIYVYKYSKNLTNYPMKCDLCNSVK